MNEPDDGLYQRAPMLTSPDSGSVQSPWKPTFKPVPAMRLPNGSYATESSMDEPPGFNVPTTSPWRSLTVSFFWSPVPTASNEPSTLRLKDDSPSDTGSIPKPA